MAKQKTKKRINITLSRDTLKQLDNIAEKGERSKIIDQAVQYFLKQKGKERLKERIKQGAQKQAERDQDIASDWFELEEETWK